MLSVGGKTIGDNQPCFIIAEAGSNHNGDLSIAKDLIDRAAGIGADAVKFQLFTRRGLSSESAIQEILGQYEFPPKWIPELQAFAREKGVVFFATPFDEGSVEILARNDAPLYKIASGDLTHIPLLKAVARQKKPVIFSVGVGSLEEIEEAIAIMRGEGNNQLAMLHCIANYPTKIEEANLRVIPALKDKFGIPVGFSDHTMDSIAPAAAVALGANVVEKHFTLSRSMEGPDHPFALEPDEFEKMVRQIRDTERALGSSGKRVLETEKGVLVTGRRSLYLKRGLRKGETVHEDDLDILRPRKGIEPGDIEKVIGRKAKEDLSPGHSLQWQDLEAAQPEEAYG